MAEQTPPGELTEEQRREVFREELRATARHGRRALRPVIPPKFVWGVAATFIVLGLGGVVFEHFYGYIGQPSKSTTAVASTLTTTTFTLTTQPQTTAAFMGLREIASAAAPNFTLEDQSGRAWTLSDQRGHEVLVTFYDANCSDICPVLGAELRQALSLLSARGISVDVAIVNSDPRDLAYDPAPASLTVPGLSGRSNVRFLTGTLRQLNAVWTHYGVSVNVNASNDVVHNDVLYFVDPGGHLRALATPFANESPSATFTLSTSDVSRFAQGIAAEAGSLAR